MNYETNLEEANYYDDMSEVFSSTNYFNPNFNNKISIYNEKSYLIKNDCTPTLVDIEQVFTAYKTQKEEELEEEDIKEAEKVEKIKNSEEEEEGLEEVEEEDFQIINYEENQNIIQPSINNEENENNDRKQIYNIKDIISILKKNKFPETIINKINKDIITIKDKESVYLFESRKLKRKYENKNKENLKENKSKNKIKKGRKMKDGDDIGIHKKDSSDNIIKKCKAIFFSCVIKYIQKYINQYKNPNSKEIKLLKLNYSKYVNRLKKDIDLELLEKSLKDLASFETSSRYRSNDDKQWNKKIIDKVYENEKDNIKIMNLLNMSFGEWIDYFTLKNELDKDFEFNELKSTLEKIAKNNNEIYFSRLILYLYNYKRWFKNKKGRNRSNK